MIQIILSGSALDHASTDEKPPSTTVWTERSDCEDGVFWTRGCTGLRYCLLFA